jgi:hypothetical protein
VQINAHKLLIFLQQFHVNQDQIESLYKMDLVAEYVSAYKQCNFKLLVLLIQDQLGHLNHFKYTLEPMMDMKFMKWKQE